jgi:hypothetical protein
LRFRKVTYRYPTENGPDVDKPHRCGHLNEQAESPHSSEFPATSTSQGRLNFALLTICVKYSVELNGQAGGSCSVLPNIRYVIGNGAPIGDVVLNIGAW